MGGHRAEEDPGPGGGAGVRGGSDQLGQSEGQGGGRLQRSHRHQDHSQQVELRVPQLESNTKLYLTFTQSLDK